MTIVRKTTGNDQETIYRLVREAFASAAVSDGNEVNLVNALEKSPSWIPELSLVAEKEGILVGYILFTKAMVGQTEILALAPLAVLPSQQGHGIGRTLIEKGIKRQRNLAMPMSQSWVILHIIVGLGMDRQLIWESRLRLLFLRTISWPFN